MATILIGLFILIVLFVIIRQRRPSRIPLKAPFASPAKNRKEDLSFIDTHYINLGIFYYSPETLPQNEKEIDWSLWRDTVQKAFVYSNQWKLYGKAKKELIKAYIWLNESDEYLTILRQTFRQIIERYIKGKRYQKAYEEFTQMFHLCPNYSSEDVIRYNTVVDKLKTLDESLDIEKKELGAKQSLPYENLTKRLRYDNELRLPEQYHIAPLLESYRQIMNRSCFLRRELPFLMEKNFKLRSPDKIKQPSIKPFFHFIKDQPTGRSFLAKDEENIYTVDWSFTIRQSSALPSFDTGILPTAFEFQPLSQRLLIGLNDTCSLYIKKHLVKQTKIPGINSILKKIESLNNSYLETRSDMEIFLQILDIENESPEPSEIDAAFKDFFQSRVDRLNSLEDSEQQYLSLRIEAYEKLTHQTAEDVFLGEDTIFIDTIKTIKDKNWEDQDDHITVLFQDDHSGLLYFGTHSGIVFEVDQQGLVRTCFTPPPRTLKNPSTETAILDIQKFDEYLHILTKSTLFICREKNLEKVFQLQDAEFKWHQHGFVKWTSNWVRFFLHDGEALGEIKFQEPIIQLAYHKSMLLVQTSTTVFRFSLSEY